MTISPNLIKNAPLIITLTSAYSYFCSYLYEVGCCDYYNIPIELISVSIMTVIKLTCFFLLGLFFLGLIMFILSVFADLFLKKNAVFGLYLRCMGAGTALFSLSIPFWQNSWLEEFCNYISMLGIICLSVRYIIKKLSYTELKSAVLLAYYRRNDYQLELSKIIEVKILQHLTSIPIAAGVLISILFASFNLCPTVNHNEHNFYFLKQTDFVLIKKYQDDLIFKRFDRKAKAFGDSLLIIKSGDSRSLQLTHEFIER